MWVIEWTPNYIVSQVFVALAVLSLALSVCTKNRILILLFGLCNSIFFGLQYFFLKEYAGAILNFIGIVRAIWFYFNDKFEATRGWRLVSLFICLIFLIVGDILSFGQWYSIFPLIATVTFTIGIWQKNILAYRISIVIVECFGVLYNIMCKSLLGVIFEGVLFVIAVVSVIRYVFVLKKNSSKEPPQNINSQEKAPV